MASAPASPEISPLNSTASWSFKVPVVPAKVTDCPLGPSISTVAPFAMVTGALFAATDGGFAIAGASFPTTSCFGEIDGSVSNANARPRAVRPLPIGAKFSKLSVPNEGARSGPSSLVSEADRTFAKASEF